MLLTGDDVIITSSTVPATDHDDVVAAREVVTSPPVKRQVAVSIDRLLPSSADKPLADGPIPSVACLLRLTADPPASSAPPALPALSCRQTDNFTGLVEKMSSSVDTAASDSKEDNNNVVNSVSLISTSECRNRFVFVHMTLEFTILWLSTLFYVLFMNVANLSH